MVFLLLPGLAALRGISFTELPQYLTEGAHHMLLSLERALTSSCRKAKPVYSRQLKVHLLGGAWWMFSISLYAWWSRHCSCSFNGNCCLASAHRPPALALAALHTLHVSCCGPCQHRAICPGSFLRTWTLLSFLPLCYKIALSLGDAAQGSSA